MVKQRYLEGEGGGGFISLSRGVPVIRGRDRECSLLWGYLGTIGRTKKGGIGGNRLKGKSSLKRVLCVSLYLRFMVLFL